MTKQVRSSSILFILYAIFSPIGIKVVLQNMTFNTATVIVFGALVIAIMYSLAYIMTILYKALVDIFVYKIFKNSNNVPDVNNMYSFTDKARGSIFELKVSIIECKIRIKLLYIAAIIIIIYSIILIQIIIYNMPIPLGTGISILVLCMELIIMIRISLMLKKHKGLMDTARSGIYLLYAEMDEQDKK